MPEANKSYIKVTKVMPLMANHTSNDQKVSNILDESPVPCRNIHISSSWLASFRDLTPFHRGNSHTGRLSHSTEIYERNQQKIILDIGIIIAIICRTT